MNKSKLKAERDEAWAKVRTKQAQLDGAIAGAAELRIAVDKQAERFRAGAAAMRAAVIRSLFDGEVPTGTLRIEQFVGEPGVGPRGWRDRQPRVLVEIEGQAVCELRLVGLTIEAEADCPPRVELSVLGTDVTWVRERGE